MKPDRDALVLQIQTLRAEGASLGDIAKQVGISKSSVAHLLEHPVLPGRVQRQPQCLRHPNGPRAPRAARNTTECLPCRQERDSIRKGWQRAYRLWNRYCKQEGLPHA